MSVRKTIKIITLAGAAAMLPGVASAATPAFGSWTSTESGGVSTIGGCPATFTCTTIISGDDIRQANVTDGVDSFVQTVITDDAATCTYATCDFSDENFVKTDGVSTGIKARQSITDTSGGFAGSVQINSGWALTGGVPNVDISQTLSDPGTGAANDEFDTSFGLEIGATTADKSMDISQSVKLGVGTTDYQDFEVRERSGSFSTVAGTATLPLGGGDSASWVASNDVMVTWIDQVVDIGGAGSSLFAFQSVENKTVPDLADTFSTTANNPAATPFDWAPSSDVEDTFGVAP